jgi:hypothetical protein
MKTTLYNSLAVGVSEALVYIRFTMEVACENSEPSRVIPRFEGEIFDISEDDNEVKIGKIFGYLVQAGRAFDEKQSLFEAMDSIDQTVHECYGALFDPDEDELWSASVRSLYGDNITSMDVLFIEGIELNPNCESTDIAPIVRETIATFGSNCGLVSHGAPENVKAWTDLGFRKLPDSDFYTYAPELLDQGGKDDEPVPHVAWANRVRRGRRRLDRR